MIAARRLMVAGILAVGVSAPLFAGERPESLSEWAQRQQTVGGDAGRLVVDSSRSQDAKRVSQPQTFSTITQKPNPLPLVNKPVAANTSLKPAPTTVNASLDQSTQAVVKTDDISSVTAPKAPTAEAPSMFASNTPALATPVQPDDQRVVSAYTPVSDDQTHAYASRGGTHVSVGVGIGVGGGVGVGVGVGFGGHGGGYHGGGYHGDYHGGYRGGYPCGGYRNTVFVGASYVSSPVCYDSATVVYSEPVVYDTPVYCAQPCYTPVYCAAPCYTPVCYTPVYRPVCYQPVYRPVCYPTTVVTYRSSGCYYPQPFAGGFFVGVHGRF